MQCCYTFPYRNGQIKKMSSARPRFSRPRGFTSKRIFPAQPSFVGRSWKSLQKKFEHSHRIRNAYSSKGYFQNTQYISHTYLTFSRHDKLIIDDHVYIFNEQEHRIERLPSTISATTGLEDEVGDVPILTRRLKQKQSLTHANFNANAKRAQSVESMLDRIPAVGTVTPHSHSDTPNLGMSSSVSSYNVNSSGYNGSSPERKSKHRASSTVPANNETETDTDMEMAVDDQKSP